VVADFLDAPHKIFGIELCGLVFHFLPFLAK
jgi:hypothetical protein